MKTKVFIFILVPSFLTFTGGRWANLVISYHKLIIKHVFSFLSHRWNLHCLWRPSSTERRNSSTGKQVWTFGVYRTWNGEKEVHLPSIAEANNIAFFLFFFSCPIPFGHNSCVFMRADFTKPFPDCCLRIECPKDKPPRFISRNKLYDLLKISWNFCKKC